jgi:photosystem II stability/assembly factor-like uncharacterized protein
MRNSSTFLLTIGLPIFLVGTLQLSGCTSKKAEPVPPGGAYLSSSGGAQFDQSVNLVDGTGTSLGHIASLSLNTIHRSTKDPAVIFVTAGGNGVIISYDNGETWQKMAKPIPSVSSVVVLENDILLVSGSNQDREGIVMRSLDKGKSWDKVLTVPAVRQIKKKRLEIIKPPEPPPLSVTSLTINPFHPDKVYAATSTGDILMGEQSGKLWHKITISQPVRKFATSPHRDGELLIVSTSGQLIKLTDNEQEKLIVIGKKTRSLDAAYVNQLPNAMFVSTASGAATSTDRGETWSLLSLPISTSVAFTDAIARVSPTNASRLLVSINNIIFRSEDGGRSWNSLSLDLPNHSITDISIDPTNASRVLLITKPYKN